MKLYKLFEEIILEAKKQVKKPLISNVTVKDVISAIEGHYYVNITYNDYPNAKTMQKPSKRYIQIYDVGVTKTKDGNGNLAIRAYQIFGGSKRTPGKPAWKLFRLDRIVSWEETNMKYYEPPKLPNIQFNPNGDKSMARVIGIANFEPIPKSNYAKLKNSKVDSDIDDLSPDEWNEKMTTSIQKSKEKYKVTKPKSAYTSKSIPDTQENPEKPVDTSKTTQTINPKVKPKDEPNKQSAYMATSPNKTDINKDKKEDNDNTTTSRPKQVR